MRKEDFYIDLELLKKAKERGFCLCDTGRKRDKSNVCPCSEFLTSRKCKCGVFTKGDNGK